MKDKNLLAFYLCKLISLLFYFFERLIDKEQKQTKKKDTGFNHFAYHRFSAVSLNYIKMSCLSNFNNISIFIVIELYFLVIYLYTRI